MPGKNILSLLLLGMSLIPSTAVGAVKQLELAGLWAFRLDPDDEGIKEGWARESLPETIWLPGALQAQGFGEPITTSTPWTGDVVDKSWFSDPEYERYRQPGKVQVPFWLQPDRYYVGPAWYQRILEIPATWKDQRITLDLERPHWTTRVWVDGIEVGSGEGLSVPHRFDLSKFVTAGRKHRLTLRVDNRMHVNVGPNSHSVSDHTQSNWNGIVGDILLRSTPEVWIDRLIVVPDVGRREAHVTVRLGNSGGKAGRGHLQLAAASFNGIRPHRVEAIRVDLAWDKGGGQETIVLPMGKDSLLWDEFQPALYRLKAQLIPESEPESTAETVFGLREVGAKETQITVNGRPVFLRGTLDCAVFPNTGYPPTDRSHWRKILQTCKDYGLNHVRFHSWCPPEAAFEAADELGIYFQIECASWANQGASIGDGKPLDDWLYREGERILREYGNHPSLLMMAYGNEPGGKNQGRYLTEWIEHFRGQDLRHLYTGASGWPFIEANQFHVTPEPRIQRWGEELRSIINAQPPQTTADFSDHVARYPQTPLVSHEIGQWCAYPNFDEISKYTGHLKPKNLAIFRDFLAENHMADQGDDFLMASGKLQTLAYKADIEMALRTPGFGGFQLLGLQDFSGQGTALVGVVDAFWEPKPYVTAEMFRRFCAPTVPLALMGKRVFTPADRFEAELKVSHFGPSDLAKPTMTWSLAQDGGEVVASGQFEKNELPTGKLSTVGKIDTPLTGIDAPIRLTLEVALSDSDFSNSWDIWVMEDAPELATTRARITTTLDEALKNHLETGGMAWLRIPPGQVQETSRIGFSPVFWNTAWTREQAPHTLGLLTKPEHPALASFPTEDHSDWQWWEPVTHSRAMSLDGMPPKLQPIVQPIDTWFKARRLGLVFEARVGKGRLLVTSIDFDTEIEKRKSLRQLRASLQRYIESQAFDPKDTVSFEQLEALFVP